jgi:hypothetical protein
MVLSSTIHRLPNGQLRLNPFTMIPKPITDPSLPNCTNTSPLSSFERNQSVVALLRTHGHVQSHSSFLTYVFTVQEADAKRRRQEPSPEQGNSLLRLKQEQRTNETTTLSIQSWHYERRPNKPSSKHSQNSFQNINEMKGSSMSPSSYNVKWIPTVGTLLVLYTRQEEVTFFYRGREKTRKIRKLVLL